MSKIVTFQEENIWKRFPGTSRLTPRLIVQYVQQGIWSDSDLEKEGLKIADSFDTPEGKVRVGEEYFNEDGTQQLFNTEDAVSIPPSVITPLQARKALRASGLYTQVTEYIQTLTEEEQEEWEYAVQIERTNPILVKGSAALGLTEEQLDSLFILGASL